MRAACRSIAGNTNIGGFNYNIAASSFSNNVYRWEQTHLAQAVTLKSATDGKSGSDGDFGWEFVASDYNYLTDNQRVPSTAFPAAAAGGAGTINRLNGTGWYTLDAKGVWTGWTDHSLRRACTATPRPLRSSNTMSPTGWRARRASTASNAKGRTATDAIWLQDIWSFAPDLKATLGGRFEEWRAYDGVNFSASPALNVEPAQAFDHRLLARRRRWPGKCPIPGS